MKERPIIFSGDMIRAILDGRKTQTRRTTGLGKINKVPNDWARSLKLNDGTWSFWYPGEVEEKWVKNVAYPEGNGLKCPYGQKGSRLWVRETFCFIQDRHLRFSVGHKLLSNERIIYKATDHDESDPDAERCKAELGYKWKPSIHMPRWASRITLEVVDVRVERLQKMTFRDWVADFCPSYVDQERALETFVGRENQIQMAKKFWDTLDAKRGFGWDTNPWVWVIEFRQYLGASKDEKVDIEGSALLSA